MVVVSLNYATMISTLQEGRNIESIRAFGNSMTPLIKSGQSLKIEPAGNIDLEKGDMVFCKVRGNYYIHKITAIEGDRYQISNNHGHINGWTTRTKIYGIVTEIFD